MGENYACKAEFSGIHDDPAQHSVLEREFPELMEFAKDDETAIVYWPEFREFGIPVMDGGGSKITIHFDPWSGRKLPEPLRDKLFDTLKSMGIEADITSIPPEFRDERWWIERGL